MVGFTALGQRNESLALSVLEDQRRLVRPVLKKYRGKEVKTIGDGFLVDFPSALNAVNCAYEIQEAAHRTNESRQPDRRMHLRIGIHLGDVLGSKGDISGDAVNIASRLEAVADGGGVCISRQVYDQVQNKFDHPLASLGMKSLKNVKALQEVYKIVMPWDSLLPASPSEREHTRIAILPFANVSPTDEDEYFADGMTDELITVLSRIKNLRVIARTSSMRFKGEKATAGRIGQELKVGSLIEGSVRKSKERVRIAIQLVDTQTEEQLWSETYDRDLRDVFQVQAEIAQQVAKSLELRFGTHEQTSKGQHVPNQEAYALYLKGRFQWNQRTERDIERGIKYFEEAIGRDPNYALAYAGLADCYSILGYYGFRRSAVVSPWARELAERALSLDDNLAEPHASLGQVLMQYYFDWKKSGAELDRALEINPSYATAHFWRATQFMSHGRFDECLTQVRKARDLDPLSMIILTDFAKDLYLAGKYDQAIEQYKQCFEVDPKFAIAHKGLAEVYAQVGLNSEAVVEIERAIKLSGRSVFILDDLGYIYAKAGRKKDALTVVKDLDRISADEYVPAYGRSVIYAALGETETALTWLERAYEERSFLVYIKVDPAFEALRKEERYQSVLNKMGL